MWLTFFFFRFVAGLRGGQGQVGFKLGLVVQGVFFYGDFVGVEFFVYQDILGIFVYIRKDSEKSLGKQGGWICYFWGYDC